MTRVRAQLHVLTGAGLRLTLDPREVFTEDPGLGTPAMVETLNGRFSATFWCACDTGELGGLDFYELSSRQREQLERWSDLVDDWCARAEQDAREEGR